mmetsp:Transcript_19620/g.49870  ORF Transcript_19620/g.49870 Transcript_19620/m.49870 type:complete len:232 (-) Transcript_19620:128-823(-)
MVRDCHVLRCERCSFAAMTGKPLALGIHDSLSARVSVPTRCRGEEGGEVGVACIRSLEQIKGLCEFRVYFFRVFSLRAIRVQRCDVFLALQRNQFVRRGTKSRQLLGRSLHLCYCRHSQLRRFGGRQFFWSKPLLGLAHLLAELYADLCFCPRVFHRALTVAREAADDRFGQLYEEAGWQVRPLNPHQRGECHEACTHRDAAGVQLLDCALGVCLLVRESLGHTCTLMMMT